MASSDSELDLVTATKAAKRTPPRPLPPAAAAAPKPGKPGASSSHSTDSEEGFDLIAAAKQQRSSARAQPASPRHTHAASASPTAGGAPRVQSSASALRASHSSPPEGAAASSDSDSEGQDMVALARKHGRQARAAAAAGGGAAVATRRDLNYSISLAAGTAEVEGPAQPLPAPAAAPATDNTQQPAPPARSQQLSRTGTVVVHEGVPVPPSLLELAAGQLPQLPGAGQEEERQAAAPPGRPFAFSAAHSRRASSLQGASPHSPHASSQYATAGTSRSPSRLATVQPGRSEGGGAASPHAQANGSAAAASPAPSSPGVPLASLADLGDVLGGVVQDLKSSLSADIGRLEAGWAQRWREQAEGTAELRSRLDRMAAASDGQAQEVSGRLQALQGELAQQRCRLEAVERASAAALPLAGQPREPCSAAEPPPAQLPAQGDESQPAAGGASCGTTSAPPATSVEAIMRRLSLLESRVGAQLSQIEAGVCGSAGCSSGGGSAPVSPLRFAQGDPWAAHAQHGLGGSWSPPVGGRSRSRAAQAAAVAAAAVWGSTNGTDGSEASLAAGSLPGGTKPARDAWCGSPNGLPTSPRIRTAGVPRPSSAGPGYGGYGGGSMEEGLPGWRAPSSCGPGRRSRAEVDAQVAATHALISGIHSQIAAIKSSLAGASGELQAQRAQAASTAQRLEALERTDRCMASVESANLSSVMALERRVRELEGAVATASTDAAAGRLEAKQARATLAALEWRVDKSSDATIGTLKALEARQDKMRSELHAVAGTATLAGAKADSLAAEVARLQRRVHGSGGAGSPLSPRGGKAAWRLY